MLDTDSLYYLIKNKLSRRNYDILAERKIYKNPYSARQHLDIFDYFSYRVNKNSRRAITFGAKRKSLVNEYTTT